MIQGQDALDTAIDQSEKTMSLTKKSPGNKIKSDQ